MDNSKASAEYVCKSLTVNNFDGLRLLFASMVVLFHIGILTQSSGLAWMTKYISSTFAVQAFFFVSGFLVFMSCDRSKSLASYFKKRFFRIFPAYLTVVVGVASLMVFVTELPAYEYITSPDLWHYLFYNLSLVNFLAPTLPGVFLSNSESTVNGSLWTIKIEIAFYCLVPFLIWLVSKYGYRKTLSLVFGISLLWKCGFSAAEMATNNDLYLKLSKQLPGQLSFFVGGAYAYYRTRDGLAAAPAWLAALGVLGYALSDGILHQALAPICVTVIIYWMAIRLKRIWSAEKYGDFSYGLYLFHFPVVQTLISVGGLDYLNDYSFVGLSIAITLFIAVCSWYYIEKPSLMFLQK